MVVVWRVGGREEEGMDRNVDELYLDRKTRQGYMRGTRRSQLLVS